MRFSLGRRRVITIVVLVGLLGTGLLAAFETLQPQGGPCGPAHPVQKSQLSPVSFGAVTKYPLPANRSPNAITVQPDGSVWFGELGSPGVAHLYVSNRTLVEYRWPYTYQPDQNGKVVCSDFTDTWGILAWDGQIWATDGGRSQIVGLNPSNDSFQYIHLQKNSFPYTLAVSPDGRLWFSMLSSPPQVGRVDPGTHAVTYFPLPSPANSSSAYVLFVNSSLGYALSIHPYPPVGSNLYSFDPSAANPVFAPVLATNQVAGGPAGSIPAVGGQAATPTSVAFGQGGIWLTEHFSSDMAFYSYAANQWATYPTSSVSYVFDNVSLPYFDVSNGTGVWFNEHYGNKLAEICCNRTGLSEYSLADSNNGTVDNALTLALGKDKVWFTEWTAGYVGFVNTSYSAPFSPSVAGSPSVTVKPGSTAQLHLTVTGRSSGPLHWQFSDNEQGGGVPKGLGFSPTPATITSLSGNQNATVNITCAATVAPGQYIALVTVTDGLVYKSVYVQITVTG